MYCTWTKRTLVIALALASLHAPALAVVTMPEVEVEGAGAELLEVSSSGYSRFEIADGSVVAFFTGGVEARYAGHILRCEELRINQELQRAELSGGVALSGPLASLSCPTLTLDLASGEAELNGGLSGSFNLNRDPQTAPELLRFAAGSARLTLPAPDSDLTAGNLRAELEGMVLLTAPDGSQLSAPRASYDGPARRLDVPGPVVGIIALPAGSSLVGAADQTAAASQLYLEASGLSASFDQNGEFAAALLDAPRFTMDGARLQAAQAELRPVGAGLSDKPSYELVLSGGPVRAQLLVNGQQVSLAAARLRLTAPGVRSPVLHLQGKVQLRGGGFDGVADEATLTTARGGSFGLAFPRGIRIGADIAGLAGLESVPLEELTAQR